MCRRHSVVDEVLILEENRDGDLGIQDRRKSTGAHAASFR